MNNPYEPWQKKALEWLEIEVLGAVRGMGLNGPGEAQPYLEWTNGLNDRKQELVDRSVELIRCQLQVWQPRIQQEIECMGESAIAKVFTDDLRIKSGKKYPSVSIWFAKPYRPVKIWTGAFFPQDKTYQYYNCGRFSGDSTKPTWGVGANMRDLGAIAQSICFGWLGDMEMAVAAAGPLVHWLATQPSAGWAITGDEVAKIIEGVAA